VKPPFFLLVSMLRPAPSTGISYPGLFVRDEQLPSPLNGSSYTSNSLLPLPQKQGPKLFPQHISLPVSLEGKLRQLDRLKSIASLSPIYLELPGDFH
jgi:hypothetical protein